MVAKAKRKSCRNDFASDEAYRKFAEKRNIATRNCRQRKKQELELLREENPKLRAENDQLRAERDEYKRKAQELQERLDALMNTAAVTPVVQHQVSVAPPLAMPGLGKRKILKPKPAAQQQQQQLLQQENNVGEVAEAWIMDPIESIRIEDLMVTMAMEASVADQTPAVDPVANQFSHLWSTNNQLAESKELVPL